MRLESGIIYKDTKRGNYILPLTTTRFGINFIYCNKGSDIDDAYRNVPELFIDEQAGWATFDRIIYVPWTKFNCSCYEVHKDLGRRTYTNIVSAISSLFLGNISGVGSVFEYAPMTRLPSEENNNQPKHLPVKEEEKIKKPNPEPTFKASGKSIILGSAAPTVEQHDKSKIVTTKRNDQVYKSKIPAHIEKAKTLNIPIDSAPATSTHEKYYDLTAREPNQAYPNPTRCSNTTNKNYGKIVNTNKMRLVTELEAMSIATSTAQSVADEYNVSLSIAGLMIRNAKRIFGEHVHSFKKGTRPSPAEMFKSGKSLEEALNGLSDSYKNDANLVYSIKKYYSEHKEVSNNDSARDKWDELIAKADFNVLLEAASKSIVQFAVDENCSSEVATQIMNKIVAIIEFEPEYVVFGPDYAKENFKEELLADHCISKKDLDVNVMILEAIDIIKPAYQKSYNNHSKINNGTMDIPSEVPQEFRTFFSALIFNRFNRKMFTKKRVYSKEQLDAIKNRDIAQFALAFAVTAKQARYGLRNIKFINKV